MPENFTFKNWYYNENGKKQEDIRKDTPEDKLEKVIGFRVHNLKTFISWLILNKHIEGTVKIQHSLVPKQLLGLNVESQINYITKNVKNIKTLAQEFDKRMNGSAPLNKKDSEAYK